MSKYKKILIISIAMVVVIGGFVGYYFLNKSEVRDNDITLLILKDDVQSFKVVYNPDKGETILTSNKGREVISVLPRSPLGVLKLPEIKSAENTIKEKVPISTLTYNSSLEESTKYMNYIKKEGYKVIRQVHTPQYIDEVLKKDIKSIRVVIFKDSIMVGDVEENSRFTQFEKYLKKYK